jgi:hypothetical protein
MLGGFVDSLLQMFENCRAGLSDEVLRAGADRRQAFFAELYEQERSRLLEVIRQQDQHLGEKSRLQLFDRIDDRIRKVVIPAYARLAGRFTIRERNDFYLVPEALHGLERLGWGAAGIALGVFAVWAPFVPLWEKEWVIPFALAGLLFPNLRRFVAQRRYQSELNALVARTDNEIWRMDLAYLTDELAERMEAGEAPPARLEAARAEPPAEDRPKPRAREGGR